MSSRFRESLESIELTSFHNTSSHGAPILAIHPDNNSHPEASAKPMTTSVVTKAQIEPHLSDLYVPFWLRTGSLLGLILLFTLLLISLIAIWRIVVSDDGLSLALTSSHYAWTYGPTAILIVVLGLWRQVDYSCKLTQPWRHLGEGPLPSQDTVLLDYISPMQVMSLYRSFRQRHAPVALSTSGFLLLKFIILVSTALFVLTPTTSSTSIDVKYADAFNSSNVWSSIGPPFGSNLGMTEYSGYTEVGTDVVWSYLTELNGQHQYPGRTKDSTVFQSFALPISSQNITSLTSVIDLFSPNITCEPARVAMLPDSLNFTSLGYITFDTDTCSVGHHQALAVTAEQQLLGMYRVNCSDAGNGTTYTFDPGEDVASSQLDYRYVIFIADFEEVVVDPSYGQAYSLAKANAAMCKIEYTIKKADLTQDLLTDSTNLTSRSDPATMISNMTELQLSELIFANIVETNSALQVNLNISQIFISGGQTMFQLISAFLGPSTNIEAFYDQSKLTKSATAVLQGLTLQFGRLRLLQPTQEHGTADALVSGNKLKIRNIALVVMVIGFAVMILLSAILATQVRKKVVPQKPGSIASYACVFARIQSLITSLRDTGHLRTSELTRRLHDVHFKAEQTEQGYSIEATNSVQEPPKAGKVKEGPWTPLAVQLSMLVLLLILSLLAIAGLEVLYRISVKKDGVVGVGGRSDTTIPYTVLYGSTLTVLLIATLFNNLDFTIATFTPYSALKSGHASANESLLLNLLGDLPPVALFKSIRFRRFGATMSLIAATIGSFLTVIVSGLWTTDYQVMISVPFTRELSHTWNLTWANHSYSDGGAAMILNTFDHGGILDPSGTWEDHALPFISNGTTDKDVQAPNGSDKAKYELKIHALHPELSCLSIEQADISYGTDTYSPSVLINTQLPASCRSESSGNSSISFTWDSGTSLTGDRLLGTIVDLDVLSQSSSHSQATGSGGCPSLAVIFGSWRAYSALMCSHRIRSVPMTVFYSEDPSADVTEEQSPPIVDKTQPSRYLLDPATGQPSFFYKIQQHLARDNLKTMDPKPLWDPFFDHLINGPYNATADSIVGQDNTNALITAVNKIYNKYMIQVINLNFRVPMENTAEADTAVEGNTDESTTVNGTVTRQTARLKINFASKLALQIMLSVMLLLGGAALLLVQMRRTLPRSPHSIASVMGFLAGSKMCDFDEGTVPPASEFLDERGLKVVFRDQKFSLGWWTSSKVSTTNDLVDSEEDATSEALITQQVAIDSSEIERFGIDVHGPMAACEAERQGKNPFRHKTVETAQPSIQSRREAQNGR